METLRSKGYSIYEMKDRIVANPQIRHQTLIWLHGSGESAKFALENLCKTQSCAPNNTKIIFLQSPARHSKDLKTKNLSNINSWFEAYEYNPLEKGKINFSQVNESSEKIIQVIQEEAILLNNKYSRIFIGGFSEGSSLAIYVALKLQKSIGGVIAMSGFLLPEISINDYLNRSDIKFVVTIGKNDEKLPLSIAYKSFKNMNTKDFDFNLIELENCRHEVNSTAIDLIHKLIQERENEYSLFESLESNNYIIRQYKDKIEAIPKIHKQTFIWLHELNGSAKGSIEKMCLKSNCAPLNTKLIFLESPMIQVKALKNTELPVKAWFDMYDFNIIEKNQINFNEVQSQAERIISLIDIEANILKNDYSRIYLGGFSQGCALSIYIGLKKKEILGGILGVSGWLFPEIQIEDHYNKPELRMVITHGKNDKQLPFEMAQKSFERLNSNYFSINFCYLDGKGHEICDEVIKQSFDLIESSNDPYIDILERKNYTLINSKNKLIAYPPIHKNTLICLHGLGQNTKKTIEKMFKEKMCVPETTKLVFLQAPMRKVDVFKGRGPCFPSWFNLTKFDFLNDGINNLDEIKSSAKMISDAIDEEAYILDKNYSKVFLLGGSQGCAMALYVALNKLEKIGGLIGIMGYLMKEINLSECLSKKDLPILLLHSKQDQIVPFKDAMESYKRFVEEKFFNVKIIPQEEGPHDLLSEQVDLGYSFLKSKMEYMNSLVIEKGKENNIVRFKEICRPHLNPGYVLVSVFCSPIGFLDDTIFKGSMNSYPFSTTSNSSISSISTINSFGIEGSGIVKEAGKYSDPSLIGKKVAFSMINSNLESFGTFSEYAILHESQLVILPQTMNLEESCSLFVNPLTVLLMIEEIKRKKSKCIIQTAAGSTVGKMLLKECLKLKININNICIVRNKTSEDELKKLGAKHILISNEIDFASNLKKKVLELEPNIAFDAIGEKMTTILGDVLLPNSDIFIYGNLGGDYIYELNPLDYIFKGITLRGLSVFNSSFFQDPEKLRESMNYIINDIQKGGASSTFKATAVMKFPLDKFSEAFESWKKNSPNGRTIFIPTPYSLLNVQNMFYVHSPAFSYSGLIPKKYSNNKEDNGDNCSIPLEWGNIPTNTKSLALVFQDSGAQISERFTHWILWNISPFTRKLNEGISSKWIQLEDGTIQGLNSLQKRGYSGPAPSQGTHRYYIILYALDQLLNLKSSENKESLEKAMNGHIIQNCTWVGKYTKH